MAHIGGQVIQEHTQEYTWCEYNHLLPSYKYFGVPIILAHVS